MKNKYLPLVLVLFGGAAYSQVGIGTLNPNDSVQLEVVSADKGILIPRVALLSREDATTITPGNVNSLLVFNTTDNDLIKPGFYYWFVDNWEKLANSTDLEELEAQDLGGITMVVVGDNLVLTDVHGNSTQIALSELNILTTLVNNNNGSYTYTSENGTVTTINVTEDVANYFETILNEGPITIGGETYNTFEEYLTHVVKSNETVTTLVNNNNGTYTYVSENGTVTVIDIVGDVANYFDDILNQGPIVIDGNTYNNFDEYLTTIIKSKETITTLVNNNNGSYTYTSENGTVTTINVTEDVANYFEAILNEGPITIGGETYNTFEEYLTHVVKSNETVTTLVNNNNGTYTYVSENGTVTVIDIVGDVANYFDDILNQGPIVIDGNTYNNFDEYLTTIIKSKETVTTLINNDNGTYTYTSENGTTTLIDVPSDVANYFETILQKGPITIDGDTYTTFEDYLTHVVKSNETVTRLTYSDQNNSITYTNEIGEVEIIPLSSVIATISNELQSVGNVMTSNVNGETSSTNIVNSNVLSLNPTTKILTSSVNGVVSTGDVIDLSEIGIEPWNVLGSTDKASSNTEDIYQMGKVAVGASVWPSTPSSPDVRLYIDGDLELNGKFWSTTSIYADYVFEKYFTGNSNLKSDYTFNKLSDVKKFIKQNHHLPGVTPIGDLKKNENGYIIDFSKLSNEQLEKIEELYIHTIEQQELIEQQASEINSLKERLDRLEKLIK